MKGLVIFCNANQNASAFQGQKFNTPPIEESNSTVVQGHQQRATNNNPDAFCTTKTELSLTTGDNQSNSQGSIHQANKKKTVKTRKQKDSDSTQGMTLPVRFSESQTNQDKFLSGSRLDQVTNNTQRIRQIKQSSSGYLSSDQSLADLVTRCKSPCSTVTSSMTSPVISMTSQGSPLASEGIPMTSEQTPTSIMGIPFMKPRHSVKSQGLNYTSRHIPCPNVNIAQYCKTVSSNFPQPLTDFHGTPTHSIPRYPQNLPNQVLNLTSLKRGRKQRNGFQKSPSSSDLDNRIYEILNNFSNRNNKTENKTTSKS